MLSKELIYETLLDIKSLICVFFELIKKVNVTIFKIFKVIDYNIKELDFDLILEN